MMLTPSQEQGNSIARNNFYITIKSSRTRKPPTKEQGFYCQEMTKKKGIEKLKQTEDKFKANLDLRNRE